RENREAGENPARGRRCMQLRSPAHATVHIVNGKAAGDRCESEDLPGTSILRCFGLKLPGECDLAVLSLACLLFRQELPATCRCTSCRTRTRCAGGNHARAPSASSSGLQPD